MSAPILERINAAIDRIASGHGLMRVPVDETDPDVVLADCRKELTRLRAEKAELVEALQDAREYIGANPPDNGWGGLDRNKVQYELKPLTAKIDALLARVGGA